jgi:hypothetical protein
MVSVMDSRVARGWFFVPLLVLCAASPALASFPGRNGEIVYGWIGESSYRAGPTHTSIRAVDPNSRSVRVLRDCPLLFNAQVAYTDCMVSAPRSSPDGLRIAFPTVQTSPDFTGQRWQFQPGLGAVASGGTGLEEHATENRYWELAWAPAGDRFLLGRQLGPGGGSGDFAIFLASLEGTELSQVTPDGAQAPDWSSTGQIAFTRFIDPCPPRLRRPLCDAPRPRTAQAHPPRRVRSLLVAAWEEACLCPRTQQRPG